MLSMGQKKNMRRERTRGNFLDDGNVSDLAKDLHLHIHLSKLNSHTIKHVYISWYAKFIWNTIDKHWTQVNKNAEMCKLMPEVYFEMHQK